MGAVMGSKQLKAVAVRGSKTVEVAKIDELVDLCDTYYKKIMSQNPSLMKDMGTVGTFIPNLSSYVTPIRNFQSDGAFEGEESIGEDIRNISMKWLQEQYVHKGISCASCPIACEHIDFIREGEYKDIAYKTGYQAVYALGSNCGIRNFPAIVKAEQLCDTLGMDFISTGGVIAWAMECFEKGILTLKDTDGIELNFGNHEALIEMIPKIARREGLGNILAEGVKRASEKVGKDSNRFAMHSKGLEFAGFDVRVMKAAALSFAVSTKASFYEPEITVGHLEGLKVGKDLAKFVMEKENSLTILDMLMLCKFSVGTFPNSYNDLARLYTLVTGARLNADELRSVAERIWNMEKVYNIREGWTRKDDSLPPRVFEPITDGGAKGSRLSEGELNLLLNDYYAVRGWTSDGTPKKRKLGKMGLKAVAKEVGI
jgi:aldehyde:ferredoxin oxidoreductase